MTIALREIESLLTHLTYRYPRPAFARGLDTLAGKNLGKDDVESITTLLMVVPPEWQKRCMVHY